MRKSFIPYDKWTICRALRACLESLVFPIPNTNEAIPGKFINICDIVIGRESEKKGIISIEILFKGNWHPDDLEFELVENYLDELLQGWNRIIDFMHNGIEYIGTDKLMIELNNLFTLLRQSKSEILGGLIILYRTLIFFCFTFKNLYVKAEVFCFTFGLI